MGQASWYGGKYHGRQTASGEIFDTYQLTAAHKTLPFGTMVRVINQSNGKSVTVRINDRGPFVAGRIIDLSYAAAEALDFTRSGVTQVKIEWGNTLSGHEENQEVFYTIQAGAFSDFDNALALKRNLVNSGFQTETKLNNSGIIRILIKNVPESRTHELSTCLAALGIQDMIMREN